MNYLRHNTVTRIHWGFIYDLLLLMFMVMPFKAQQVVTMPEKSSPAKIDSQFMVVSESVVKVQWPHTLKLVNAPQEITLMNPGQCVRIGIAATGDKREEFLAESKITFHVKYGGQSQDYPLAAISQIKQIKPEGADFVTDVAAAGGIQIKNLSMAVLGVSADSWCVPANATDGSAKIEVEVQTPSGHKSLKSKTIQIESYETGSKKAIKDAAEFSNILITYYRQPNPARLLPVLQFMVAMQTEKERSGVVENTSAFLTAALKVDPFAAKDFLTRMGGQSGITRDLGLLVLKSAGYEISSVVSTLGAYDQGTINNLPPLADPYDLSQTQALFGHLDLMWSTFGATGQYEPIKTIASTLSWHPDYEDFDKRRKAKEKFTSLTPDLVRALTYSAAGWSMGSFQRTDPLVADYIDYMKASPEIPETVKIELSGLTTNDAFKRQDQK